MAALCAVIAASALLAYYLISWAQVTPLEQRGSDFSASYVAATLVRAGGGDRLYDQSLESAAHQALLPPGAHANLPYITPPTTALLALPFSFTDPGTAFRSWSVLQLVLLVLAVVIAAGAAPWPTSDRMPRAGVALLALAGVGSYSFLLLGQSDAFNALGLAAGYAAWRRGSYGRAGLWLGLGAAIAKPHLALGVAVWLVATRRSRALAGAAGGVVLAGLASLAVSGPGGLAGFAGALGLSYGHTPPASTVGFAGLAASWLGSGWPATVATLTGGALGLGACAALGARVRQRRGLEVTLGGATALSLAISPHLLPHDLVVLGPVLVWVAGAAASAELGSWPGRHTLYLIGAWVALDVLATLDTGNAATAPPGRLIPWGLLAAGAAALAFSARGAGAAAADPASSRRSHALTSGPAALRQPDARGSPPWRRRPVRAPAASGRDAP